MREGSLRMKPGGAVLYVLYRCLSGKIRKALSFGVTNPREAIRMLIKYLYGISQDYYCRVRHLVSDIRCYSMARHGDHQIL
jgi:hypothetical protein